MCTSDAVANRRAAPRQMRSLRRRPLADRESIPDRREFIP
jgi:hypothetical protein